MNESVLGVYKLLDLCGEGAYGKVHLAENTLSGGVFALKILNRSREKRELEGLIRCRECRHENLIRIHHIDRTADGRLYYTMDAADNAAAPGGSYTPETLALRIERSGALPASEVKKLASALLSALGALHGSGLIHRDIKPENILFVNGVPVLGDIGLIDFSSSASLVGTPAFIRPEVLSGKRSFDEKSDLYALGMTVYCALTGWQPEKYPHLPNDLPSDGADVLEFCRAACSGDADMEKLRAILAGGSRPSSRRRRSIIISAVAVLLLAAVAVVALYSVRTSPDPAPKPAAATAAPPSETTQLRRLTPQEWRRECDRLFKKYAIPEEFRAKCDAHVKETDSSVRVKFLQQLREHPEAAERIQREWRREQMRLTGKDPLYGIGSADGALEMCMNVWDPELVEVNQSMLNGLESILRERYELYLAATGGK